NVIIEPHWPVIREVSGDICAQRGSARKRHHSAWIGNSVIGAHSFEHAGHVNIGSRSRKWRLNWFRESAAGANKLERRSDAIATGDRLARNLIVARIIKEEGAHLPLHLQIESLNGN